MDLTDPVATALRAADAIAAEIPDHDSRARWAEVRRRAARPA